MDKKRIGYVSNVYYYYRRHDESITSKKHDMDLEEVYLFHSKLQDKYDNHPLLLS